MVATVGSEHAGSGVSGQRNRKVASPTHRALIRSLPDWSQLLITSVPDVARRSTPSALVRVLHTSRWAWPFQREAQAWAARPLRDGPRFMRYQTVRPARPLPTCCRRSGKSGTYAKRSRSLNARTIRTLTSC
jgi:hypothetical protein